MRVYTLECCIMKSTHSLQTEAKIQVDTAESKTEDTGMATALTVSCINTAQTVTEDIGKDTAETVTGYRQGYWREYS